MTAGLGELELAEHFKAAGDDYYAILASALADRLAEAFAEALHYQVRTRTLGVRPGRAVRPRRPDREQLPRHPPRPGYPAQPDHTEKATLFELLDAEAATGMRLTESFAMTPPPRSPASTSPTPRAHYFGVGKIERDQVEDYARRKGWDVPTAERWLSPILNYEPGQGVEAAA